MESATQCEPCAASMSFRNKTHQSKKETEHIDDVLLRACGCNAAIVQNTKAHVVSSASLARRSRDASRVADALRDAPGGKHRSDGAAGYEAGHVLVVFDDGQSDSGLQDLD